MDGFDANSETSSSAVYYSKYLTRSYLYFEAKVLEVLEVLWRRPTDVVWWNVTKFRWLKLQLMMIGN
jgi:hypothetical protein